jgi:hypothetical protein
MFQAAKAGSQAGKAAFSGQQQKHSNTKDTQYATLNSYRDGFDGGLLRPLCL